MSGKNVIFDDKKIKKKKLYKSEKLSKIDVIGDDKILD